MVNEYRSRQYVRWLFMMAVCLFGTSCGNKKTAQATIPDANNDDAQEETLVLSYVGNMGVLVESEGKTVLFDGFHKEYGPDYLYPTAAMAQDLRQGTYDGFSTIDVACVTHKHGDHFDAAYYKSFLEENKEALVVGPNQVKKEIAQNKTGDKDSIEERVKAIAYDNEIHSISHQGVEVKAMQCNHVNQKRHASIENIAFLVEINDFKILHVGDTNWDQASQPFIKFELKNLSLDVAILPYWMLLTDAASERLEREIDPKHLIATHIPPNFTLDQRQDLLRKFKNITLFTELGERLEYKRPTQ